MGIINSLPNGGDIIPDNDRAGRAYDGALTAPDAGDSAIGFPNAVLITILEPRKAKSIAPTFWISLHILTQSPQRMHFPASREMQREEVSSPFVECAVFGKRTPRC